VFHVIVHAGLVLEALPKIVHHVKTQLCTFHRQLPLIDLTTGLSLAQSLLKELTQEAVVFVQLSMDLSANTVSLAQPIALPAGREFVPSVTLI